MTNRFITIPCLLVFLSAAGCATNELPPISEFSAPEYLTRSFGRVTATEGDVATINVGRDDNVAPDARCYIHRDDLLVGAGKVIRLGDAQSKLIQTHQHDDLTVQVGDGLMWLSDQPTGCVYIPDDKE